MTVVAPDPMEVLRRHHPSPGPVSGELPELNEREREVLDGVCRGLSGAEIAGQLFLSESSIKAYLTSLMRKFDVTTRIRLLLKARDLGLNQPPLAE